MSTESSQSTALIVKAAKKTLKNHDTKSMKLETLVQTILESSSSSSSSSLLKIQNNLDKGKSSSLLSSMHITKNTVQQIIQNSNKFQVQNEVVSLKRKHTSRTTDEEEDDDNNNHNHNNNPTLVVATVPNNTESKTHKKKKKMKKENNINSTMKQSMDLDSVQSWRLQHKIVVLTHNNEQDDTTTTTTNTNNNNITPDHNSLYFPYHTFDVAGTNMHLALIRHCTDANGFTIPSPIQAQSWPLLMEHKDMVGIAETGSGKTLAFALPFLSEIAKQQQQQQQQQQQKVEAPDSSSMVKIKSKVNRSLPRLLVLSPTRELALQSSTVLSEFGAVVGIETLTVYGGVPKGPQITALKRGTVDCLVATPGRLNDLVQDKSCDLSQVQYLCLDEADRMLDAGFEEEVRWIIGKCRRQRQTAMFSATWPAAIQKLAMDFMKDPIRVYVGFDSILGSNGANSVDDSLSANKRVEQIVEVIEDRQREVRLRQILDKVHGPQRQHRVLVFALYKKEAERLEHQLRRDGWKCCSIHGNKNQPARTEALQQFKDGTCPLLVATDVAARGLDIPNVEAVINYTFPLTIEDYIHRIGRTGRAGKTGVSYTFFQPTDKSHAGELQQVLRQVGQPVPEELARFGSTIKKKEHKLYGSFGPKSGSDATTKKATKITFNYDSD